MQFDLACQLCAGYMDRLAFHCAKIYNDCMSHDLRLYEVRGVVRNSSCPLPSPASALIVRMLQRLVVGATTLLVKLLTKPITIYLGGSVRS
jgi:hypothetical protein